jgi:hypothetical protein
MQSHKERNWKIFENRLLDVSTPVRHLDGLQFSLEGLPFRALEQILYFLYDVGVADVIANVQFISHKLSD